MSVIALAANVEPWQGAVVISALASAVVFLFKWGDAQKRDAALAAQAKVHTEELAKRDVREAQLRAECEARYATQAREFTEALRREHVDNRAHEDGIRKEFTSVVATISDQTSKSAEALTEVLGRLHDRFTGPPRPRH